MSFRKTRSVSQQILFLIVIVFSIPGIHNVTITPDHGSTINISSNVRSCSVCTGSRDLEKCSTSLLLKDHSPVSLKFTCLKPQDIYRVEVVKNIECATRSCSSHIIQADSGSLPLFQLPRRFTWNIKASEPKALKLDFAESGLEQINPSEECPDKHNYTLQVHQTGGSIVVGKYCRVGDISSAEILNQASFSLDVPAGQKLHDEKFDVSVGEEIKSLAKISLTLPKGTSSLDLLSPNYPDSFPDDDVMEWYFKVPDNHKVSVQFLNLTQPRCLKKETAVEYKHSSPTGRGASVRNLNEVQPEQKEGSFLLSLRNCKMDRRLAHSPGLSLNLRVFASPENPPEMCNVGRNKTKGLDLYIQNVRPDSECEMKMNSTTMRNITVTSNSLLSFQGCKPGDVRVTARRVIECSPLQNCAKPFSLKRPVLPSCIPANLSSVTWILRPLQHGTVRLTSHMGPLKRDLPGQRCKDSFIIEMAEEKDGHPIGRFCPQGAIQKVLIHSNVSITWRGSMAMKRWKNGLDAAFIKEIPETYIFYVSPPGDSPVLVASPGWPLGMKYYSTISWIVTLPKKKEAHLKFSSLSQPKCRNRHTSIKVQRIGSLDRDYGRREDEEAESEIIVSKDFYLNMSNCMPERGDFSMITQITVQKKSKFVLTLALSVVAALLIVFVTVLVVICLVIRKKKMALGDQISVYNSGDANFLPGQRELPNTAPDLEHHVYDTIDDTLVYTHLLKKGEEERIYEEYDTYQSLTESKDSQKPLVSQDEDDDEKVDHQPNRLSSQGPSLPERPRSHLQLQAVSNVNSETSRERREALHIQGPEREGGS